MLMIGKVGRNEGKTEAVVAVAAVLHDVVDVDNDVAAAVVSAASDNQLHVPPGFSTDG